MEKSGFYARVVCRQYSRYGDLENDFTELPRPFHTFAYVQAGRLECITAEGKLTATEGDVLFIPHRQRYLLWWKGEYSATLSCHFLLPPGLDPTEEKQIPLQKVQAPETEETFAFLTQEHGLEAMGRFYLLCHNLFERMECSALPPVDGRIRKAMQYLQQEYRSPVTVEQLAAVANMSPSRFFALFKKETGVPPMVYKNQLAVQHAALMLAGEESVEEIAAETGFASAAYFRRVFKAVTGVSPREYRKGLKLR